MRNALIAVILLGLLGAAGYGTYKVWVELGDIDIGFDGKLALGLMIVFALALGIGLMGLVFYSNRRGFDK